MAYWLESPFAQFWLHQRYRGIDMPGLNLRDVRKLPVPIAPLEEQIAIEERLNTLITSIAVIRTNVTIAMSNCDSLDYAILFKAFSGTLVRQYIDDEPASILVDRISQSLRDQPLSTTQLRATRKKEGTSHVKKKMAVHEDLVGWLKQQGDSNFSFEDVRDAISANYNELKDSLFKLLDDPSVGIQQYFDEGSKSMKFRRTSK